MFFMVLDLRLTKVGTRRSPFFCAHKSVISYKMIFFFLLFLYFCTVAPFNKNRKI